MFQRHYEGSQRAGGSVEVEDGGRDNDKHANFFALSHLSPPSTSHMIDVDFVVNEISGIVPSSPLPPTAGPANQQTANGPQHG